jgi:nucleotidyltransferase AbiEii toxin of type IV toxin-antitoxin system
MPANPAILGFANRWQGASLPHATKRLLPSGTTIRAVPPPYLLATKLEALSGRGRQDFLGSRDFADVIALVDGRAELVDEVRQSDTDLRMYLADELARLATDPRFLDGVAGALRPDSASQARAESVVRPRLREIIAAR